MSEHLIVAYVIFCTVPLALSLSIAWRRRRVRRVLRRHTTVDKPSRI